jgi:predicted ribosomally synthesized peptide with SipW-like signal peptide
MKRIILSSLFIFALLAGLAGATYAVFSDSAVMGANTFATGVLEIRVNGQPTVAGFSMTNAAPGACQQGQFTVNNYGAPFFAGPSTLAARELVLRVDGVIGDEDLFDELSLKVEANRGWPEWMGVYDDPLSALVEGDLLGTRWSELAPGHSHDVRYEVCLSASAGNELQGKTTSFDFIIDAYNPVR